MPNIVFINRFFYPDYSATSQMLSDLLFELAASKNDICVITSRMKYDDPLVSLPAYEIINNVHIYRVQTSRFGRSTYRGRAKDYLSFYFNGGFQLWKLIKKGDIVIAKTDPPMISVIAAVVVKLRGAILVNWLQDLFPEVAVELKVKHIKGITEKVLMALRNWSLAVAKYNVVLGALMAQRLYDVRGMKHKVRIMHNWSNGRTISPLHPKDNLLRLDWGLKGKFVIGYSGNFGQAHEFTTLLQAMDELKNHKHIMFLFIGGGTQLDSLKNACVQKSISNVIFKPYQPRTSLRNSLTAFDVHIVVLKPELEGLIVPSKFYGIAASGRPTLFIGSPDGEIATIITSADAGYAIKMGDYQMLIEKILLLEQNAQHCDNLGQNARKVFEQQFDNSIGFEAWKKLLVDCE